MRRALAAVTVALAVVALAALPAGAGATTSSRQPSAAEKKCIVGLIGGSGQLARSAPHSASAKLLGQLAVLRRAATKRDAVPPAVLKGLTSAGGATSFDPTRVRLLTHRGKVRIYVVAVSVAPATVPASCKHTTLASTAAQFVSEGALRGSGAGVCLLSTALTAVCENLADLDGYNAVIGGMPVSPTRDVFLLPDGVHAIHEVFSTGKTVTPTVVDNLVTEPLVHSPAKLTPAAITHLLAGRLPASITEQPSSGGAGQTYTQPAGVAPAIRSTLTAAATLTKLLKTVAKSPAPIKKLTTN